MAVAGSSLWWLGQLETQLTARQAEMQRMDAYYRGDHPLPFLTKSHKSKLHDEFSRLLQESRSNFMRLVVDATEERLAVEGFRLSARSDENDDAKAWDIWQANQMDAQSQTAFLEALVKGVSYLSVWPDVDKVNDGRPIIAVEDPTQTIVAYVAGTNYRRRSAALKVWLDEWTGEKRANVYLPDGIRKFRAKDQPRRLFTTLRREPVRPEDSWEEIAGSFAPNVLNTVPIIPLRNRPRLLAEGESEIADVASIQNQVNGFLFLLALAGYFGAHRQRWATGIKLQQDNTGKFEDPIDTAIDQLWINENPDGSFGDFEQTSLDGYIKAIEQKVLHIAVTTRTPRHYLFQEGQSPSGDAIESAESGLVKKVGRKQRAFGEGLEEAIRLARRFAGEKDAPPDGEIVWANPATRSDAVVADATIKQFQARIIPRRTALAQLGYTQTEIERISAAGPDEFSQDTQPQAA